VKNVVKESVMLELQPNVTRLTFRAGDQTYAHSFQMFQSIDPDRHRITVGSVKLEIMLYKQNSVHWKQFLSCEKVEEPIAYPSSSKVKHDWDHLEREAEKMTAEEPESVEAFFQNLYSGASEESKRAMMKSFV